MEYSRRSSGAKAKDSNVAPVSKRNMPLGIFRLLRYHTFESLLSVYPPVYGACYSFMMNHKSMPFAEFRNIILANWLCATLTHGTICTFNDIADRNFDGQVERTKNRPLPSGMISVRAASIAFIVEMAVSVYLIYATLGQDTALAYIPVWILFVIYPFMKRVVQWPQIILGITMGMSVLPGWASVSGFEGMWTITPMVLVVSGIVLSVYNDTIYATQDSRDDKKAGVKSFAVLLQEYRILYPVLTFVGFVHLLLVAYAARAANMSAFFWTFGISAWAASLPLELHMLDPMQPKTAARIFQMNIFLNGWVTAMALLELCVSTYL
ncbi:hypothetical protein TWF696_004989 [Orbilia brochopaga]|uniref:Uncharacterized protein n=1 Tax=Orbilia brochopaga TaxID=3140254 RepID=A0AAV9UZH1_9PEZI